MFRDELTRKSQIEVIYMQNIAGAVLFLPFIPLLFIT